MFGTNFYETDVSFKIIGEQTWKGAHESQHIVKKQTLQSSMET